ncbi:MAG TPA: STAS-like domain-containing protein [Methanothrix sp.]|nr:STAS-like domain-containing protein [Methanothrix sp.]HPT19448.1 STAS-like domain-containing protein [Methanothrix sp.]
MIRYQTESNSVYERYCSDAEFTTKTIGARLDNRTSSAQEEKTQALQVHGTSIEDVCNMDMGTVILGKPVSISAAELANSPFCISDETATKLFHAISDALRNGNRVMVSFKDVTEISSAFFESAFGKLYLSGLNDRDIKRNVTVCDLSEDDKFILDRVIDRIRNFLEDPIDFKTNMNEILGEDNE